MAEAPGNHDYEDIKAKIRDYILSNLAERRGVTSIADDDSLLENGVVDSLGIFLIISFLEENFHVGIPDDEITPNNFRTLGVIAEMVESKLRQKSLASSGS